MRRLTLSANLLVAALPLLVAVVILLAFSIGDDLHDVDEARRGAQLGSTWDPLITSIQAVEEEARLFDAGGDRDTLVGTRRATDATMSELREAVSQVGDSNPMVVKIGTVTTSVSAGRVAVDSSGPAQDVEAAQAYDMAERELIGLGRLLPAEAGDPELGRTLLAVASLATTEHAANDVVESLRGWPESGDVASVVEAAALGDAMVASVDEFENVAPDEWLVQFREGRWSRRLSDAMDQLDRIVASTGTPATVTFDAVEFGGTIEGIASIRDQLAHQIVTDADTKADTLQRSTFVRIGITLVAVLLAGLMAWLVIKSITRRVRAVSDKAREVAAVQLPALVGALRDPRGRAVIPAVAPIEDAGTDELGQLAASFNAVQATLVEVAHEQVEVLRRGVSDIFVTMARRTRSLIDRQLALLDELEADVDDPAVLANYYQLDHLATRMRRNSESLLVLANAESQRGRTKPTGIDDVVRAAIGEVEEYRRIDVLVLDHLRVRGAVVADISHLLAELLDNASAFSPPDSRVRVSGRYAEDQYLVTISDDGVGIGEERLVELNDLLANPPIVGLSVEPTLGMSVVSLLAHKHGVRVQLVASTSGVAVEIMLPATLYSPVESLVPQIEPTVDPPLVAVDTFTQAVEADLEVVPVPTPVVELEVEPGWSVTPHWAIVDAPEVDRAEHVVAEEPERRVFDLTPPHGHARLSAEFDRAPAPPALAGPESRPFTEPMARPLPARRTNFGPERRQPTPSLPIRPRGASPADGPDRLADRPGATAVAPSAPSALRSALSAFQAGRADARGVARDGGDQPEHQDEDRSDTEGDR